MLEQKKIYSLNREIVREYDIRGVVDDTLNIKDAYYIGIAVGTMMHKVGQKTVCVGFDGRLTSEALSEELCRGLKDSGCIITNIGCAPTPMVYFAREYLHTDLGIVVTGSHNPAEYNGFKITGYYGKKLQELADLIERGDFISGEGAISQYDISEEYVTRIIQDLNLDKKLRIAWDPANGAGSEICNMLVDRIDAEHFIINNEIDGNFPNHHPDPTVEENLEQLKKLLLENNCDVGISFDGDADRIGVIDDKANVIWGDQLLIFYSREILQNNPGQKIIADIKASKVFSDEVSKAGGCPIIWKSGHSLIKVKMQEESAVLAGEMSGHIFFNDIYYGYDDGLYSAMRLLNIIGHKDSPKLSEIYAALPKMFSTPELRIACEEATKFQMVDEIKQKVLEKESDVNDIDGVRVTVDGGWWLIRASNTSPCLVARCEAESEERLEELVVELKSYLAEYNITFSF